MAKKKSKKKAVEKKKKMTAKLILDSYADEIVDKKKPSPKVVPYPTAGKKISEFEEKLDQQITGEPPKRGRGRPRKDSLPEPEFALDENIIRQTIKMPFDLWAASQKLDELKLQDPEAAALAAPTKQLLDYYLPNMPTIAIAWLSLAVTSYSIMVTRLSIIAKIKKEKASPSSGPVSEDIGQGGPRSPDLKKPAGQGGKIKTEFPTVTKPVKI